MPSPSYVPVNRTNFTGDLKVGGALKVTPGGTIEFGNTPDSTDVFLYRNGANTLRTDSNVEVGGGVETNQVTISGASHLDKIFITKVDGEPFPRTSLNAGGGYDFGSGQGAPDVNLYRNGAGVLRTDSTVEIGGSLGVSGNALNSPQPSASGYQVWNADPVAINANGNMPLGQIGLTAIYVSARTTVTKFCWGTNAVVGTLTPGQCWAGIYTADGQQKVVEADISGQTGSGLMVHTFAPTVLTPGMYYVAFLPNATAGNFPMGMMLGSTGTRAVLNGQLPASQYRFATIPGTGATALPATFNPAANTWNNNSYWVALS